MKSIHKNQTQLRTLLFGLLCVLAGVMCFAQSFSHGSVSPAVSKSTGERQGVSPPSATLVDAGSPQFTSLTPRYVTKRIADLEVGEEVVAKDPESGEVTTKRVANVFRKVSDHLRILQVRNSLTNEVQTIETTDDHPFWVPALSQWMDAKDLKLGDRLDDVDNGTAILESTSRELHPDGIPVFNFEVEDFHTYFVRAHGSRGPPVLTHNTDCNEFQAIVTASQTNSIGLGSTITVGTPGIDGLPGSGVFDTSQVNGHIALARDTSVRGNGGIHVVDSLMDSGKGHVLGSGGFRLQTLPQQNFSAHGNRIGDQPTWLYELWEGNQFLKHGVHQDVAGYQRYSDTFLEGKELRYIQLGTRENIMPLERFRTELFPGPMNLELWAGTRSGYVSGQWRNLQTQKLLEYRPK